MSSPENRDSASHPAIASGHSRYEASVRLSVAPMMDWTDSHCRVFHRLLAPNARLYSEMVHANAVIHGDRARLLAMDPLEHPVALQLGGSEPELLAQAARIGADTGFDEINLNCGCPSDRVQAGRFGACLMREPALVAASVKAMIGSCDIPVTVKCRLGVDDDHDYGRFRAFIDEVAEAGCTMFVVHARNAWLKGLSPKENREVPPLRYDWAYRLKSERPELQVIVNGGINDADEATTHLDRVDGAMLGRGAYHDPYLLHRLDVAWFGGELRSRAELLRAYRPYVQAQLARGVYLKHIVRHVLGLFAGQHGGRAFRQVLSEGAHKPGADWSLVERALAVTESFAYDAAASIPSSATGYR
ncbi:tRNA dihydrouridine(20/20a) synthase DusA [Lysobacter sp. H21R4]|uniref:tRNA dihydrouridine(20/20a) synthase DusA n=1 Tax=Lysobacter sp. H21R4 TaxID=2781021 RepID=UPI001888F033|nr:tRNA dihydrouridine(20/20a) synthase DusA [Lysobacter sp. H21R4]QOY63009.1 tRNA dihydrouridine(20/20a) synthase DusA [Lysobacter sp. H21R4]